MLLRPLPYPESDRLVFLYESFPGAGVERAGTSVPNYFDRLAFTDVFDSQTLYQSGGFRVGQGAGAEGVASMSVSPSFFNVLKTSAARGRVFIEDEGTPGKNRVTVLSWAFARRQAGGVDGIVGRELVMNDERYNVVGVMPESFSFLNPEVRLWVPLAFTPEERGDDRRYSQNHEQMARLAPGVTLAQARQRIDAQSARNIEGAGPLKSALINAGYRTEMGSFTADLVRNVRAALQMLWGGVACLLLIAAVNITNLSLARATGRLKEVATRTALGAARGRVVRQLVTETTVLTLIGGGLGLALGFWSLGALTALGLADIPRAHEIRMDAVVVVFILGLATALGVIVGAVPAMHIAGINLSVVLREDGRTGTAGRGARRVRGALVVAQVALAFVLLIGAGLLMASFRELLNVNPGFTPEHVLTGRVSPLRARYPDAKGLAVVYQPCARANPCAPRRRGRRRDELPAVQLGQQQQRDHPRGIRDVSWGVGGVAESVVCDPRLSRGAAGSSQAGTVLRRERHGRCARRGDRRRAARAAVLAERESRRPPDVPAAVARRCREAGPEGYLAAGRGRGRQHQAQGTRRRRRDRACRRVLHPYAQDPPRGIAPRDPLGERRRREHEGRRRARARRDRSRGAALRQLRDARSASTSRSTRAARRCCCS